MISDHDLAKLIAENLPPPLELARKVKGSIHEAVNEALERAASLADSEAADRKGDGERYGEEVARSLAEDIRALKAGAWSWPSSQST